MILPLISLLLTPTLQNSVEPTVDYGSVSCSKPVIANSEVSPTSATIGLYESYTVSCDGTHYLTDATKSLVGISSTMTCVLDSDGETGVLSPTTPPICEDNKMGWTGDFFTKSKNSSNTYFSRYDVDSDVSCLVKSREAFIPGDCREGASFDRLQSWMDLTCADGMTLIGYYTLRIMDDKNYWGKDILIDNNLMLTVDCRTTADFEDLICANADQESHSDTRMYVRIFKVSPEGDAGRDSTLSMSLLAGDDSVKYRMACDSGYSFPDGVDEWSVYGFCASTGGTADPSKNTFTATTPSAPSASLSCHAVCKENPAVEKFSVGSEVSFEKMYLPEMRSGGSATATANNVVCESGTELSVNAPSTYTINCDGAAYTEAPYSGKLSCSPCPICHTLCPANPTADDLDIPADNAVASITIATSQQHGQTVTVSKDDVTCKTDYTLPDTDDAPATYQFTCGENGVLSCTTDCPVCKGTCAWPAATDSYDYRYVDGIVGDKSEPVIPGSHHVEAYCLDEEEALVGPRFLSCLHDNTLELETAGYPDDTGISCQANVTVCEKPEVTNAILSQTGNILVGEEYTVTCQAGSIFDAETQETYGSSNVAAVVCDLLTENGTDVIINDQLPSFECYEGCGTLDQFTGIVQPGQKKRNSAPYPEGTVLTFTCQEGYNLVSPEKRVQTCSGGTISAVPTCTKEEEPSTAIRAVSTCLLLLLLLPLLTPS